MEKEQLKVFSERLTKLRQKKELTQQQLGEILQIPRVSITRYETAERTPTVDHLVQFAQFFNVPSDYLLGLSSVESYDIELQSVCEYTGLSEETIENIRNCCFMPKVVENRDYEKPFSVQYFTPEYYKTNKYIINNILSNDNFWTIVFHLCSLMYFSNELQTEYPDIDQLIMQHIGNGVLDNQQLKEYYNKCNSADVCRYSIMREIEKISDLFDSRVEKEGSDNGKHNPPKE